MNKFTSKGLVLASVAGSAVGTVCPSNVYTGGASDGSNFFENLVAAAVVDWSNSGTPAASAAVLSTALYTTGLHLTAGGSATNPAANPWLAAHLANGSSCSTCAFNFYANVIEGLLAYHTTYGSSTTQPLYACNSGPNSDYTTPNAYSGWSSIQPNGPNYGSYTAPANSAFGITTEVHCITAIQSAIDKFNDCANNGYDIRTGAISTICINQDDFLNVDAIWNPFTLMMKKAFNPVANALPSGFSEAYTALPCRSCFDSFMATIATADIGSPHPLSDSSTGLCGTTNGGLYATGTGKCLDTSVVGNAVTNALNAFSVCTGSNTLYISQPYRAKADNNVLFNDILKSYQAVIECGATSTVDPINSANPITPDGRWTACLLDGSAHGGSIAMDLDTSYSVGAPDWGCFTELASALYNNVHGAKSDCSDGAFTSGCFVNTKFNSTNPVVDEFVLSSADSIMMNFYRCSGIQLDTTRTQCSATQAATIPAIHKSFVSVMEIVLASGISGSSGYQFIGAGKNVLANSDIMDAVADLPCSSCYSRLAAELSKGMDASDVALCANPYSDECENATKVASALTSFAACSGFALTTDSSNECPADEWDILVSEEFLQQTFDLTPHTQSITLLQAQYQYDLMMDALRAAHPTAEFRCDHCFNVILKDLYAVSASDLAICQDNIASSDCYAIAPVAFEKFMACTGKAFEWSASAAPTTMDATVSTTAAPDTTSPDTTTTVAPDTTTEAPATTKSANVLMATGVVVSLLSLLL